jgi:hypothetical protein
VGHVESQEFLKVEKEAEEESVRQEDVTMEVELRVTQCDLADLEDRRKGSLAKR